MFASNAAGQRNLNMPASFIIYIQDTLKYSVIKKNDKSKSIIVLLFPFSFQGGDFIVVYMKADFSSREIWFKNTIYVYILQKIK